MKKLSKYKFGFDLFGFLMFAWIMVPNIYSMIVPPPFNFLSLPSITPTIDLIMSAAQYIMIAALCLFINTNADRLKINLPLGISLLFCVLYWTAWIVCYCGIWNTHVIMALCIFPCAAFILYIIDRKNYIALPFAMIFSLLHIARSIINFILA